MILLDLNPVQYKKAISRILRFWFIMKISDHFLFLYFFNLHSILHLQFIKCFFFTCFCLLFFHKSFFFAGGGMVGPGR